MPEKFRIGSRVSTEVDVAGVGRMEVPMRVLGYDGLKMVIVETLAEIDTWPKGLVSIMPVKVLTLREEVKYTIGEPEDGSGPAIGWMDLGGLSIGLTRDSDGTLQVTLDSDGERVHVRVSQGISDYLWEGEIS